MDKTARRILRNIFYQSYFGEQSEEDDNRILDEALTALYDLLAEGVKDKLNIGIDGDWSDGFNTANAAWRKHLQERLK